MSKQTQGVECLMDDGPNSKASRGSKVDVLASAQFVPSNTGVAAASTRWGEDQVRAMIAFSHFPSENTLQSFDLVSNWEAYSLELYTRHIPGDLSKG